MKKSWSPNWLSSTQPRKQRKYRYNAPLHIKHSFLSAHLSKELHLQYKRRSFPLRKGDEVEIMRGDKAGLRAPVAEIRGGRAYLDGQMAKKVDGSEVMRPFQPSNLKIVKLHLDDKRRLAALLNKREPPKPKPQPAKKETPIQTPAAPKAHPAPTETKVKAAIQKKEQPEKTALHTSHPAPKPSTKKA